MRRKIPTLIALSCFDAAARHESHTRAAEELAMTQSAVSRQIAALENFLGLALFRRTRHGVRLTAAGRQYARQVGTQLDALERGTLDAMARQGSGGAVQLAVVPTLATRWLMPRLPRLHASCPDLLVHIDTRTRPFLFADTEFDAAVCASTPEQLAQWPGTRREPLMVEEVIPVCSPAWLGRRKRVGPRELADAPLLQQSTRPDAWRVWFDACGVQAPRALAGPRLELFSMLAVAAAQGQGVALMPRMLVQEELARGELVVACAERVPPTRRYYFITPDDENQSASVGEVREWLVREAELCRP